MTHLPAIADAAVPALLTLLCAFALRTAAAFGLAWMIARLGTSAGFRFAVWLLYLVGTALYWVYALTGVVGARYAAGVLSRSPAAAPEPVGLSFAQIQTLSHALSTALAIYLIVLGVVVLRGLWRHVQLWHALRARIAPPYELEAFCDRVAHKAGLPRCPVWLLPSLSSAASAGCFRPAVYLPADACETPEPEMHDILCHEMTHIARRDAVWDVLLRASRALLLFHPGAAYAARALRLERELACDREVVRADPARRDAYAETLVRFGWRLAPGPGGDTFGLSFAAQNSVLSRRVKEILAGERIYSGWSRGARALLGGAAVCALAGAFPLLCVAFGAILLPSAAAPVATGAVTTQRHSVRPLGPVRVAEVRPSATLTIPAAPVVPAEHERAPRYQLFPSASAPMSDEASAQQPANSELQRAPKAASTGLPSGPTLATEAAVELGRLGASRDRDHDLH